MRWNPAWTEDLELRCNDALMGEPAGPMLARRLHREVTAFLAAKGVRGAQVRVRAQGAGMAVRIDLPDGGPRVKTVRLQIG